MDFKLVIVGCYTLDLYCDNSSSDNNHTYDEFPHIYTNEVGSICRKLARMDGWFIGKEKQLCPKCSGKKSTFAQADQSIR